MIFLLYMLKTMVCSAVMFGYYYYALRNNRFHHYNRVYLLTAAVVSIALPLLDIQVLFREHENGDVLANTLRVITVSGWEEDFVVEASRSNLFSLLTVQSIATVIYLAGVVISLFYLLRFFVYIRRLSARYKKEQLDDVAFYNTREPGTPFSFFKALYWNETIQLSSDKAQHILRHELYHIRAGHSYDIVLLKCISILFWFNPFFHLYLKEIKAIHEFLADEYASASINKYDYAELLVTEAINHKNTFLTNPFFHNQIKRRIVMIIKNNPTSFPYLRRVMALPILLVLFCAFALKVNKHHTFDEKLTGANNMLVTVVIDAGHGGSDPGAKSTDGIAEKDLTLAITQKIKALGAGYGVNVVLTRDQDIMPGNATNKSDGLKNRTSLIDQSSADLFVSIHVGAAGVNTSTGKEFDVYVSSENKEYEKSKLLATAVSSEISKSYSTSGALKENNDIFVLKSAGVPAVLIECGYITDKRDLRFIRDDKNQEKIAHDILKGIVSYQKNITGKGNDVSRKQFEADTIPASKFTSLNPEDIVEISITNDIILLRMKNGDTLITNKKSFMEHYKTPPLPSDIKADVEFSGKSFNEAGFVANILFKNIPAAPVAPAAVRAGVPPAAPAAPVAVPSVPAAPK